MADDAAPAGLISKLKGSGLKTRLLNPTDTFWDLRLGVSTIAFRPGSDDPGAPDYRIAHVPSSYSRLFAILKRVGLSEQDTFLDFGSGLGRAVFAASHAGARRAVGVEADAWLVREARANHARSMLAARDIEFAGVFAETYQPNGATVVYMFHPFGPATMRTVIANLEADLARKPRHLRLAYYNPVCSDVLDASPALKRVDDWPAETRGESYPVAFWESAGR